MIHAQTLDPCRDGKLVLTIPAQDGPVVASIASMPP